MAQTGAPVAQLWSLAFWWRRLALWWRSGALVAQVGVLLALWLCLKLALWDWRSALAQGGALSWRSEARWCSRLALSSGALGLALRMSSNIREFERSNFFEFSSTNFWVQLLRL